MADKERTLTEKARDVVNSPAVKRVIDAGRQFVSDPTGVEGAARAVKRLKNRKQGRSSSGRQ